jgi:hypothetical protein
VSKLSFNCAFKSSELYSLDLPVEIRKSNLALEARTLTSRPVEVKPGSYHVTARLPAGAELYGHVDVVEGQDATVTLALEAADESPNETQEEQRLVWGKRGYEPAQGGLESLGGEEATARLKAYRGNPLQPGGGYSEVADTGWLSKVNRPQPPGVYEFDLMSPGSTLVQLLQAGAAPLNMALPSAEQQEWQIVLALQPDNLYSMDVHLEHSEADALLHYAERGLLEQTAAVATSDALQGERLLFQKQSYPVAAAAGAYVLLRLGEIDRLHDWTENLRNWFDWLPDGSAIRGEHLARLGQHKDALAAFLEIGPRGLPLFTEGLSYALDRLRLYAGYGEEHFDKEMLSKAEALLMQLQRFAEYVDFRRAVLTFTGAAPGSPSREPLDALELENSGGLSLKELTGGT